MNGTAFIACDKRWEKQVLKLPNLKSASAISEFKLPSRKLVQRTIYIELRQSLITFWARRSAGGPGLFLFTPNILQNPGSWIMLRCSIAASLFVISGCHQRSFIESNAVSVAGWAEKFRDWFSLKAFLFTVSVPAKEQMSSLDDIEWTEQLSLLAITDEKSKFWNFPTWKAPPKSQNSNCPAGN